MQTEAASHTTDAGIPSNLDAHAVAAAVESAARDHAMPRWRALTDNDVHRKHGGDPVTTADVEVERDLARRLERIALDGAAPHASFVGEEAVEDDPDLMNALSGDEWCWIADPVDGTRPFVRGEDGWGTMLALVRRGRPAAGWLHMPTRGVTLVGVPGKAALRSERAGVVHAAPLQRRLPPDEFAVSHAFPPLDPANERLRERALRLGWRETSGRVPEACVEGALSVALGELAFWSCGNAKPWDFLPCAGALAAAGLVAKPLGAAEWPPDGSGVPFAATSVPLPTGSALDGA